MLSVRGHCGVQLRVQPDFVAPKPQRVTSVVISKTVLFPIKPAHADTFNATVYQKAVALSQRLRQ